MDKKKYKSFTRKRIEIPPSNIKKSISPSVFSCIGAGEISRINNLYVKNFFSIKDMELTNLNDKQEIYFVGENAKGKTLILQAIAIALVGVQTGVVFDVVKNEKNRYISIDKNNPTPINYDSPSLNIYLLAYGISRNSYHQMAEDNTGYLTLFTGGYDLISPEKWLQYLDYSEQKNIENTISVKKAKRLLQELLDSDIEIDITPNKVIFKEDGFEVEFRNLSAGYKGVITIICDLIARFSEKQQVETIADFEGIVLIDEVELHLHPKLQYNFMKKLIDTFPKIQFIVSTHSSTVILGATENATFYKVYKENGETKISQPMDNIKNLMANNLSTSPLFDMETARARNSDDKLKTDEDFIYTKIHEIVSEQMKGKKAIIEDEIVDLINKELDDYLKEHDL